MFGASGFQESDMTPAHSGYDISGLMASGDVFNPGPSSGAVPKRRGGGRPGGRSFGSGRARGGPSNTRTQQSSYGATITQVKYQCTFCQAILSSSGSLRNHVIIKHTKNSNLRCERCARVFVSIARLEKHRASCRGAAREGTYFKREQEPQYHM